MAWTRKSTFAGGVAVGVALLAVDVWDALFVAPGMGTPAQFALHPPRAGVVALAATERAPRGQGGGQGRCTLAAALIALAAMPAMRSRAGRSGSARGGSRRAVTVCAALQPCSLAAAPAVGPAENAFAGASREESGTFTKRAVAPQRLVARHLLMPKQVKHKKPQKPAVKPFHASTKWKFRGFEDEPSRCKPQFGKWALQALEEAWISSKQIENVRRAIVRTMERKGKMWIRVFPDSGITQRVAESRMGAGKGSLEYWVAVVRPHAILFEMDGVSESVVREAFRKAGYRLPCKVRIVEKTDGPSTYELGLLGVGGRGGEKVFEDLPQRLRERR